jgi:hypothetical protein
MKQLRGDVYIVDFGIAGFTTACPEVEAMQQVEVKCYKDGMYKMAGWQP